MIYVAMPLTMLYLAWWRALPVRKHLTGTNAVASTPVYPPHDGIIRHTILQIGLALEP